MLINQEGVIITDPGEPPGGIFAATAYVEIRHSSYFHTLFTSRTLQNSHMEVLCLWKNQERTKDLG